MMFFSRPCTRERMAGLAFAGADSFMMADSATDVSDFSDEITFVVLLLRRYGFSGCYMSFSKYCQR